jgi:hypothetical protein
MAPAKSLPAPAGPRAVLGKRKKDDDDDDAAASGSRKRASAAGPTKKWERIKALQALLKITNRTSEGRAIREAVTTWCGLERVMAPAEALETLAGRDDGDDNDDEEENGKGKEREKARTWARHCPKVDEIWDRYAGRFAEICGCDEAILAKLSGRFDAPVSILWHYPSFNTANERYGMVFDPSNKCVNLQLVKQSTDAVHALTADMFPMRASPPKKCKHFHAGWDFWPEYRDLAIEFQRELTAASKVRIVLAGRIGSSSPGT